MNVTINPEVRLQELGIMLPEGSAPAAKYANCTVVNGLLYLSGKGPLKVAGVSPRGKLGREYTAQEGYEFARSVGIDMLSVLKGELGSLARIVQVVEIQGFINATPEFEDHALVLNGLSDLFLDVFGTAGRHARSVFGANSLRDNLPVIAKGIFQVKDL